MAKLRTRATTRAIIVQSEGQRLFRAVPGTVRELGAELGVSRSTISDWRRGNDQPLEEHATRIEQLFGIPRVSWHRLPTEGSPVPTSKRPAKAPAPKAPPSAAPVQLCPGWSIRERADGGFEILDSTGGGAPTPYLRVLRLLDGRYEDDSVDVPPQETLSAQARR